jgi:hypothetical protein
MSQTSRKLGPLQVGIIALTLATAAIHFFLLFPNAVFILNALGYLALLGALYLPIPALDPYRKWARWTLIVYAAITVALWLYFGVWGWLGYLTKAIEIALIVLLWIEGQQAQQPMARA